MPTLRHIVLARQSAARSDGELIGAFVADRDADAFAELVRRHGAMVLGVCRRVTGDRATADDAFQAVFLVLARRASAVRPREQVGNFLYGVAYRTAMKARTVLARRRAREKQVDAMPEPTAPPAPIWADLQTVIDEELARLPDKLRVPVVLCDLEGRPQREVAKHLNLPPATLAGRLATARRTLAARLTRRGVTLSGGALAGLLGAHASASAVPPALAAGIVRAVEAVAAGGSLGTLVSADAVHLSEGVMRMMMLSKLKAVAVLAVTALALTTGVGVGLVPAAADDGSAPRAAVRTTDTPGRSSAPAGRPAPAEALDRAISTRAEVTRPDEAPDDATYLRKLTLALRGNNPTEVELWFFLADGDLNKRKKVADWMTDDDTVRVFVAKKLRVPPEHVKVVRARVSADGRYTVTVEETRDSVVKPVKIALLSDGDKLAAADVREVHIAEAVLLQQAEIDRIIVQKWTEHTAPRYLDPISKFIELANEPPKPAATPPAHRVEDVTSADGLARVAEEVFVYIEVGDDSDAEFLKRVLRDVRGSAPTTLESKYFTEDKDPKKREKLLDTLLKDQAVQKKLGDAWKAKMLARGNLHRVREQAIIEFRPTDAAPRRADLPLLPAPPAPAAPVPPPPPVVQPYTVPVPPSMRPATPPAPAPVSPLPGTQPHTAPVPPTPPAQRDVVPDLPPRPGVRSAPPAAAIPQADKFEKLVGELIAAKKSDEAILEALTLATLARLPTDSEKKLALAGVSAAADRKTAWVTVARALAGTEDKPTPHKVKVIFDSTAPAPKPPAPPAPPVPPARP
jgi:RNA polymerase sigma factor (sigma-70 family)